MKSPVALCFRVVRPCVHPCGFSVFSATAYPIDTTFSPEMWLLMRIFSMIIMTKYVTWGGSHIGKTRKFWPSVSPKPHHWKNWNLAVGNYSVWGTTLIWLWCHRWSGIPVKIRHVERCIPSVWKFPLFIERKMWTQNKLWHHLSCALAAIFLFFCF